MMTRVIDGKLYRVTSMTIRGQLVSRREMMVNGVKYKCICAVEFVWKVNRNQDVERSFSDTGAWQFNMYFDAATNTIKSAYIPLQGDFYFNSTKPSPYYYPVDFVTNTITYTKTYGPNIIDRHVRRNTRNGGLLPISYRYPVPTSPYNYMLRMYDYTNPTQDFLASDITSFFTRLRFANGFVTDYGKWATAHLQQEGFTAAEGNTVYIEAWEFHADDVFHLNLDLGNIQHFGSNTAIIEPFGTPQGFPCALVPLKVVKYAGEQIKVVN